MPTNAGLDRSEIVLWDQHVLNTAGPFPRVRHRCSHANETVEQAVSQYYHHAAVPVKPNV